MVLEYHDEHIALHRSKFTYEIAYATWEQLWVQVGFMGWALGFTVTTHFVTRGFAVLASARFNPGPVMCFSHENSRGGVSSHVTASFVRVASRTHIAWALTLRVLRFEGALHAACCTALI